MGVVSHFIKNPFWPFSSVWCRLSPFIKSDRLYLWVQYFLKTKGQILHLNNPVTYSEKIQWLKLNAYKEEYALMVDKATVKDYVKELIGEQYIVPTYGIWDKVEDIEWDKLPDSFILKNTIGSGGYDVVICRNKNAFNKEDAIRKLTSTFDNHAFWYGRERPYKNLKPRIIAEQLLECSSTRNGGDLPDYKFYCFDGKPVYCQVIRDRSAVETIDFYDMDWNHLPFVGLNPKAINGNNPVKKPEQLRRMIEIAETLSNDMPFSRIDLYDIDGSIYFGEITFYPNSGFGMFSPKEWNVKLGQLIKIW